MENKFLKHKKSKKNKPKEFTPERALKIGMGIISLGVVSKIAKTI